MNKSSALLATLTAIIPAPLVQAERGTTGQSTPGDLRCDGGALFGQVPSLPEPTNHWEFGVSDINVSGGPYIRYESFSLQVNRAQAEHLVFWGAMRRNGFTLACDEAPVAFDIRFFADNAGLPGAQLCAYENVQINPRTVLDGYSITQPDLVLQRFEFNLADTPHGPCALPADGWISIISRGTNGCRFWWASSGNVGEGSSFFQAAGGQSGAPDFDLSFCIQGAPQHCPGDADGNGVVNIDDITFVILRLGNVCP